MNFYTGMLVGFLATIFFVIWALDVIVSEDDDGID